MCGTKKEYIADKVGDDYKTWKNDTIIFDAGTGTGKTTFCIEILGTYARDCGKRILYLCNRSELRKQVYKRVRDGGLTDVIEVSTYQSTLFHYRHEGIVKYYEYVIADEAHYFMSDSTFNAYTNDAFEYIKSFTESTVIYMSATAKKLFGILEEDGAKVYSVPFDYTYIDRIVFYDGRQVFNLIDDLLVRDPDSKIIVFCRGKRMIKFHECYPNESFYCSKYTKTRNLKRICDTNCLKDNMFKTRILFTTQALDNGIDIKDASVRYIFSELTDVDILIQSLGRKRSINESDRATFYIRDYRNDEISGLLNIAKEEVKVADECISDRNAFFRRHERDSAIARYRLFIFVQDGADGTGHLEVNKMMYMKIKSDIQAYEEMKESGFRNRVLAAIAYNGEITLADVSTVTQRDELLSYLKSIEGIRFYKGTPEMESLRTTLKGLLPKPDNKKKGRANRSYHAFNGSIMYLYGNDYPYSFKSIRDKRRTLDNGEVNPYRDKTYWILTTDKQ